MAGLRRSIELAIGEEDLAALRAIARSRTEPACRVERARMLLAYREDPSFFAVGRAVVAHHQTVQRCVERALAYGAMAALDDRPRPGKEPTITAEAKAWVVELACRKAKELGYPHELWTTRLLARHAREHGPAEGHACLAKLAQGTLCKVLNEQEIKPHRVRYYLERRDPEFKQKMAQVLCVYREVRLIKETAAAAKQEPSDAVAIVSYDEKPGIQAIATTAPDLPPEPGRHATFARDHEYRRHGTVSLLAGVDLLTGQIHALVKDRHRSREFVEFLELIDAAYPAHTAIKLILDNHSAHISKETKAWLADQPTGRFEFTFTPKHGSWLNLVEGFFSKLARSVLRHIRVASKQELKDRIMAAMDHVAFSYKDYRRGGRSGVMRLARMSSSAAFSSTSCPTASTASVTTCQSASRKVTPDRRANFARRNTHYGFLAKGDRGDTLAHVRNLLHEPDGEAPPQSSEPEAEPSHEPFAVCPDCGGLMRRMGPVAPEKSGAFRCDTSSSRTPT